MDAFTAMLDGPRARGAFLLRVVLDPPWGIRVEDEAALALYVVTDGEAWVAFDGEAPARVGPGDVALIRGPEHYTVTDSPGSTPGVRVDSDQSCWSTDDGRSLTREMTLGTRTWGTSPAGGSPMLVACYDLASQVTPFLLDALPRLAVVPTEDWSSPLLGTLEDELAKDAPGQEVVLDRLLDLVLIEAVRLWFARPGTPAPQWWTANDDPVVGPALRAMQDDPTRPWTVADLAVLAGVSRAALARRFTEKAGVPPMTFLTDWRLAIAADHLRSGDRTIAAVARDVGYGSPFALSSAFKRRYGQSPAEFRRTASAERDRSAIGT